MPLPAPLSRRNKKSFKNNFGHTLILGGSPTMLGAPCLTALSAMRSGAGLVTLGIPKSLNNITQKKISNVIMTLPLAQTTAETINVNAFSQLRKIFSKFNAIAVGPGITTHPKTVQFVLKLITESPVALVIDADALNALSQNPQILLKNKSIKILTPHPGEMKRLTGLSTSAIEDNRVNVAQAFAKKYQCILVLKGYQTVVASDTQTYINKTGNVGMATAGSGDVLTGIIAGLLAQGLNGFNAAKWGVYLHGKAGDFAAQERTKTGMIATDIIDYIPKALKTPQA